jgi:maleamate amidohydrolase
VEVSKIYPSSCGINAWKAIEPTQRLFTAARNAGVPIIYTTGDTRPNTRPTTIAATKRSGVRNDPELFAIRPEFAPQVDDIIITKQRASGFFGTPLAAHLTQLGVQSLIIIGESTSGCVRATAVDGYSYGYHVSLVEECCYDRSELSHKISLFDLHHKYADVLNVDAVIAHLDKLAVKEAI